MTVRNLAIVVLRFAFDSEDDSPPIAVESLRFSAGIGGYKLLAPPLFIKDLSVGDVIHAELRHGNLVASWHHVTRSDRSTIWLLRLEEGAQIAQALEELRALGCKAVGLDAAGCWAIDVPADVSMTPVDGVLECLDGDEFAVTFPSPRHADSSKAAGDGRAHAPTP